MPLIIWIDDNLPFRMADWLRSLGVDQVITRREFPKGCLEDVDIFLAARRSGDDSVVFTKDSDFAELLDRYGPPPRVVQLNLGNISNLDLRDWLEANFKELAAELSKPTADLIQVYP